MNSRDGLSVEEIFGRLGTFQRPFKILGGLRKIPKWKVDAKFATIEPRPWNATLLIARASQNAGRSAAEQMESSDIVPNLRIGLVDVVQQENEPLLLQRDRGGCILEVRQVSSIGRLAKSFWDTVLRSMTRRLGSSLCNKPVSD